MAFSGSIVHIINGNFLNNMMPVITLSLATIIGAQIGARLLTKVQGSIIIRILTFSMTLIGMRVIFTNSF